MTRYTASSVVYLMPATGTVSRNNRFFGSFSHRREQGLFANVHTYLVMFFLVAEGTRHSATTGRNNGHLKILRKIENIKRVRGIR